MGPSSSVSRPAAKAKEPSAHERQTLVDLYGAGRYEEAEALALMLSQRFPKHSLAFKVLGAVRRQTGRLADALAPMQKAAQLAPRDWEAFNNLGVTLKDLGKTDNAIGAYRQALALNPRYAEAHSNLGAALREKGLLKEALACYRRKVELVPTDAESRYHVQALSDEQVAHPPDVYVSGVFDHYAATFDSHLVSQLAYDVPAQLVDLITPWLPTPAPSDAPALRVLDLGCGTGLVGQRIRPLCSELVGVDLSSKMLDKAHEKGVYDRLYCTHLLELMEAEPAERYDLILAADVFIYVGELEAVVAEAKRLLTPGGLLAFSVEDLDESHPVGYHLQTSGRYAHARAYLDRLAQTHAFMPLACQPCQLRVEDRLAQSGHLLVWRT